MNEKLINRYRYALCNGHIISIDDVTKESRKSSKYLCLGCGHEMVAVLGDIREHHFRHKNNESCSNETYLHNLAKKRIKEIFEGQDNFFIIYNATNSCELFGTCPFNECKKEFKWSLDLKKYFDTCEIEKGCSGFRPDLLLTHSEFPNRKLFIEINVHHPCSEEKLHSKTRIIEIDVNCENTVIYPFNEDFENIHFYNFDFNRGIIPNRTVNRFSLLNNDNGKEINIDTIDCTKLNNHLPNADFDIIIKNKNEEISLELLGLSQTILHGTEVRYCGFCNRRIGCKVSVIKKVVNESDGTVKDVKSITYADYLSNEDKWIAAKKCVNFKPNIYGCRSIIREYGEHNFILWEKND